MELSLLLGGKFGTHKYSPELQSMRASRQMSPTISAVLAHEMSDKLLIDTEAFLRTAEYIPSMLRECVDVEVALASSEETSMRSL